MSPLFRTSYLVLVEVYNPRLRQHDFLKPKSDRTHNRDKPASQQLETRVLNKPQLRATKPSIYYCVQLELLREHLNT